MDDKQIKDTSLKHLPTKIAKRPKLIAAMQAVKRLEHYAGGSLQAKELLVDKIRDGHVRAYASLTWESYEKSLKKTWASPPSNARRKTIVERSRFIASPSWRADLNLWKWKCGDFFCSGNSENFRTMYKQVRFIAEDIEKLEDQAKAAMRALRSAGGAPPKTGARDDVWLAIVEMAAQNGKSAFNSLDDAVRKTLATVVWTDEVKDGKAGVMQKLSPDVIRKMITAVRKRLDIS